MPGGPPARGKGCVRCKWGSREGAGSKICADCRVRVAAHGCVAVACDALAGHGSVGQYCLDHVPAAAAQVAEVAVLVAAEGAALEAESSRREEARTKRHAAREEAAAERAKRDAAEIRGHAADFARRIHAAAGYVTRAEAAADIPAEHVAAAIALARRQQWIALDAGHPFSAGPVRPPLRRGERRGPRTSPKLDAARASILASLAHGAMTTAELRSERPECERTFARAVSSLIEDGDLHDRRQGRGVIVALAGHELPPTAAEAMANRIVAAAELPATSPEIAARLGEDHRESTFRRGLAAAVVAGRLSRTGRASHVRYQAAA